jgi:hypothetical protein
MTGQAKPCHPLQTHTASVENLKGWRNQPNDTSLKYADIQRRSNEKQERYMMFSNRGFLCNNILLSHTIREMNTIIHVHYKIHQNNNYQKTSTIQSRSSDGILKCVEDRVRTSTEILPSRLWDIGLQYINQEERFTPPRLCHLVSP